jgi:undecaprenyl pyrophosphate phosphatase UppP
MKENKTSNGAVLRIAAAGFGLGYLVEYNRTNGFEWSFLFAYAIVLGTGVASYIFLRKGYK